MLSALLGKFFKQRRGKNMKIKQLCSYVRFQLDRSLAAGVYGHQHGVSLIETYQVTSIVSMHIFAYGLDGLIL